MDGIWYLGIFRMLAYPRATIEVKFEPFFNCFATTECEWNMRNQAHTRQVILRPPQNSPFEYMAVEHTHRDVDKFLAIPDSKWPEIYTRNITGLISTTSPSSSVNQFPCLSGFLFAFLFESSFVLLPGPVE